MTGKLKNISILPELSEKEYKRLLSEKSIYLKKYGRGATVYERGRKCDTFDIVISGEIVAYSLAENGSVTTMSVFGKGDTIGANLLFGKENSYPFNIYCTADAELLHIKKETVCAFLEHSGFRMAFIKILSDNSDRIKRRVLLSDHKTLRENLLDYLNEQAAIQRSDTVTLPMTKKQLADHLGVQRPSLFRELKNLRDEGIVDISNRVIRLNNHANK